MSCVPALDVTLTLPPYVPGAKSVRSAVTDTVAPPEPLAGDTPSHG